MKSNQRKIGAMLSYVSIIANTLVQLLYTPFLIRKLGQGEYGLFSLVSSIIGYLTVLDLGFGNAIIVHTSKYRAKGEFEKEQKLHGMFHIIYIIIGIIAGIAGVILSLCSARIFGSKMTSDELGKMRIMLFILSFNLFVTFAFSIYSSIITANEKFVFQKILAVINTIAKPLLMIPLLFLGYKSVALCVVITAANVAVLFANYLYCKNKLNTRVKFRGFDKKLFKMIFAYSFWIFLTQIVDKVNWSADQFILGAVSGTIAVSVYSAASTLNSMFISLSTAISGVLLPKVSKMVAKGSNGLELTKEMIKVGRVQYYVIFFMASALILFGQDFIRLWLGDGFEETYRIALILILPLCFPLVQNLGLSIMQAMNRYKFKAITTAITAGLNIAVSIYLAKQYGATGAAIGTAGALIICNILIINIYYARAIGLRVMSFWREILRQTIILLIPTIITALAHRYVLTDSWIKMALIGCGYAAIYGVVAYLFCANTYEKEIVAKMMKVLKRSK